MSTAFSFKVIVSSTGYIAVSHGRFAFVCTLCIIHNDKLLSLAGVVERGFVLRMLGAGGSKDILDGTADIAMPNSNVTPNNKSNIRLKKRDWKGRYYIFNVFIVDGTSWRLLILLAYTLKTHLLSFQN